MTDPIRTIAHLIVSTVFEAIPFLLMGAIISALLEKWLPDDWISKHIPQNPVVAGILGLFVGFIVPTCECGSVLIVRRLIIKGAPLPLAFSYMLAGTVVNPIVLLSTWIAFPQHPEIVGLRILFALIIAIVSTTLIIHLVPRNALFKPRSQMQLNVSCATGSSLFGTIVHEFSSLFYLFVLGAFLASTARVALPDSFWIYMQDSPWASIPLMASLAFLFSVCSEADAFVAASIIGVPVSAKLAFLSLGPVLDIKLLLMYRATFSTKVLCILVVVLPLTVLALCALVGALL